MSDDLRLAIIVNPSLPLGLIGNTVAAIAIGVGARVPELGARPLSDRAERRFDSSSEKPVPILQADGAVLRALLLKALADPARRAVVPFPAFARPLHDFADYQAQLPERDLADEAIDGLGLAGPARWVRSLTGALKLLR